MAKVEPMHVLVEGFLSGRTATEPQTLRDYFAAACLADYGCMHAPLHCDTPIDPEWARATARWCYAVADAMLAERLIERQAADG
jgi:hypothetical protein